MAFDPTQAYGFTAIPRSLEKLLSSTDTKNAKPFSVADLAFPEPSNVVREAYEHAKKHLPPETFNHSMRIFFWGSAILQTHLRDLTPASSTRSFIETFYLSCLLHDIGTAPKNIDATKLSFETYGGFLALDLLQQWGAPKEQAESVCECIVRHQDLGTTGEVTAIGGLIVLVTLLDNIGENVDLLHQDTIKAITDAYPRNKWASCFAATIRKEIGLKPWSHSTVIDNFADNVENNPVWPKYE